MVGSACHLRCGPASRKSGQHVLHAPGHHSAANMLWNRICRSPKLLPTSALKFPTAELPRDVAAEQECDRRLKAQGTQEFALLNPGAGWGAKQWPAERYGEVARRLAENGLKVADQFRSRRRRTRERSGNRQRRHGRDIHWIADSTDRSHSSRTFVHRWRYRTHASGGGAWSPGGRNLRAD